MDNISIKEYEQRVDLARRIVAQVWRDSRVWCTEKTSLDPILEEALASKLADYMYRPNLGCATTIQLIDEIKTRVEMEIKAKENKQLTHQVWTE
jgi:hypothetical protein